MTSYSQKYRTDWDYNNKNCAKLHEHWDQRFCSSSCESSAGVIVIIISIRAAFLRIWPQRRIGTGKIDGGAKFWEIKVQKTLVAMFVRDRNLARYLGKTYCVWKCKKLHIENLIIVALYGYIIEAIYYKTSISHHIVPSLKQCENCRLFGNFLVRYVSRIQLRWRLLIGLQFLKTKSKPGFFNRGLTRAHFQLSANVPDSRDRLTIFVWTRRSTWVHPVTKKVGIGSSMQVFLAEPTMSLRTSHSDNGLIWSIQVPDHDLALLFLKLFMQLLPNKSILFWSDGWV